MCNEPLLAAIAARVGVALAEFAPRGLGNIAWAFATLGCGHAPLIAVLAAEVLRRVHACLAEGGPTLELDSALEEMVVNLNSVVWAAHFTDTLTELVDLSIREAIVGLASRRHEILCRTMQT